jgi:hypothetical protein
MPPNPVSSPARHGHLARDTMEHCPFTTSKQSNTGPGLDDAVADAVALRLPVADGEGDADPARLRVAEVDSVAAALGLDVGRAL